MKNRLISAVGISTFALIALLGSTGCKPQPTVLSPAEPTPSAPVARTETLETNVLQKEIDLYEQIPSVAQSARVDRAFAEIDGEIAELVELVATQTGDDRAEAAAKLKNLREYREGEQGRYLILQANAKIDGRVDSTSVPPTPEPARDGTVEQIGEKIDETASEIGKSIEDAAETVRDKVTNP